MTKQQYREAKCESDFCQSTATIVVDDDLHGERTLCHDCALELGYIDAEEYDREREAELRMERTALHRLNGGWYDYAY